MKRYPNGTVRFFNSAGQLHNENGPAVIMRTGFISWYKDGKLHNEHGPAEIHTNIGLLIWKIDGITHRENGPAIISTNTYELTSLKFLVDGKLDRRNGPAIIEVIDENPYGDYYIKGERLNAANKAVDLIDIRYRKKTSEEKELLKYMEEAEHYIEEAKEWIKKYTK